MSTQMETEYFTRELYDLLEETFERVQGIYLDRGTSLFETLETISAAEASHPVSAKCASIAAQVKHVIYYLKVLGSGIQKKEVGKIDWEESWQLEKVTPEEWDALKQQLGGTYKNLLAAMKGLEIWEGENDIGASLGILAHTAYHLGEIRQALCVVK